jgi:hypothetical protein
MPQVQMPFFPQGVTHINEMLAFSRRNGRIAYVTGNLQLYTHDEDDSVAFRMITAQFCANGMARQAEIARTFGVPSLAVKRAVKLFRQEGTRGFYRPRKLRSAAVLTPGVCAQVQLLFDAGMPIAAVAEQENIKRDTLSKAVRSGRLRPPRRMSEADIACSKSARSEQDSGAPMGMGASNVTARVAASLGQMAGVAPLFQAALDVPCGGVLFALPALLAVGLLDGAEDHLRLPDGYYGLDSLLLLCAFMALAQLESMEALRYCAPGEWGKLLGLDRIPEVRTMRNKLRLLSENAQPEKWCEALSERWMHHDPAQAGVLYIDGHVRVYHGHQTKLPKHHVTRQRLCLRATTDYQRVPRQPKQQKGDISKRHRFTLVFDREGYSPDFLKRMKTQEVACLTYHKFPGEDWSDDEFHASPVRLQAGDVVTMDLAERGTRLSNNLWVREIRKRTESGHQTSVISTDYRSEPAQLAGAMFSRWSQENYFRYGRLRFALDRLAGYSTEVIPDTLRLVNPAWRELDGKVRKANATLSRMMAKFGATNMSEEIGDGKMERWIEKKARMQEENENVQKEVDALKAQRKAMQHHITFGELPEDQKFRQLGTQSKQLVDTIKMIAYRAETSMANILRPVIKRPDEARKLLIALYTTEADLIPDLKEQTLTVRLHHMAQKSSDVAIQKLCDELNATETLFPRTGLHLVLQLGSN